MSSYRPEPADIEVLRANRRSRGGRLQQQVESWAAEPRTFDERRTEQIAGYGPSFMPVLPLSELYVLTRHALSERSIAPERWSSEVERFLCSEWPGRTPVAQLAGDAFAAMGWLAERSQPPKINEGMIDDVQAFAVYAPFCDAFTVDSRFAVVLRKTPMAERLPSGLEIFTPRELDHLEDWLVGVERAAPPGHFDMLRATYGDGWLAPFTSLFETPTLERGPPAG
jgi:hypothetical protein